jgi:beta-phosphoglucomutase-like phosphatase (HAD superfamily)
MDLRYRCILIDHDDTAVDSTEAVHYPAHVEALRVLRPGRTPPTKDEWLLRNFHGIMEYLEGDLGMTGEELVRELEIWRTWTTSHVPPFFPGFLDLLKDYRRHGGLVAVISHSEAGVIEGHYRAAEDPPFVPDLIFGWEHEAERRKPSVWPVREALRRFQCPPCAALIVDDLKPGVLMARAAGVDFAAAGWSHKVAEIQEYMKAHAVACCARIEDLRALILPPSPAHAAHP